MDMHISGSCIMLFRVICSMFTILQLIYFFLFIFQYGISFRDCLSCTRVQSLCSFLFLLWLLLLMLYLFTWHFIFRVLHFLYPFLEPGQVLCTRYILPCMNFQANVFMLHKIDFWLSGKVIALHLDNSSAKAYLGSISFSSQTKLLHFQLGQQVWYYCYFNIHTYPSQCGCWLFITGNAGSRVASSSSHSSGGI